MAEIRPFRAVHYDAGALSGLDKVVTQPYDKISPEMQSRYYDLSPYNLARIIRGRQSPGDDSSENVYTRAARDLHAWIAKGVLRPEAEPAIYPYSQEYSLPRELTGNAEGSTKVRRGFIALLKLADYAAQVVHRHEETLSGPKADRLELLKATRAHFGQIFLLYSDPAGEVEAHLDPVEHTKPWEQVQDEYRTLHRVWRASEPRVVQRVTEAMRNQKLVIADGHHRYETAIAYRDYGRSQGLKGGRSEYVMATFVRMETPGLTILPTHRVVHSLAGFDWESFLAAAQPVFDCEIRGGEGANRLREQLAEAGSERPALGAYAGSGRLALLRLRKDADLQALLPDLAPSLARLDVMILHRILLERVLRIDRQAVAEERNLRYVREFHIAFDQVDRGEAQLSLLINPTPIEAVRDNAFAGLVLPQKSTDFYPKLLSGLTIYWLDNPAGL